MKLKKEIISRSSAISQKKHYFKPAFFRVPKPQPSRIASKRRAEISLDLDRLNIVGAGSLKSQIDYKSSKRKSSTISKNLVYTPKRVPEIDEPIKRSFEREPDSSRSVEEINSRIEMFEQNLQSYNSFIRHKN